MRHHLGLGRDCDKSGYCTYADAGQEALGPGRPGSSAHLDALLECGRVRREAPMHIMKCHRTSAVISPGAYYIAYIQVRFALPDALHRRRQGRMFDDAYLHRLQCTATVVREGACSLLRIIRPGCRLHSYRRAECLLEGIQLRRRLSTLVAKQCTLQVAAQSSGRVPTLVIPVAT